MGEVRKVAPEIRQRAAAKLPEMPPMEGRVFLAKRPIRQRAEPKIVIKPFRQGRVFGREVNVPVSGSGPNVHFPHCANRAALHQLHHAAIIIARMNLRAHLRDALADHRRLGHRAHFGDSMRQRFLAIQMPSALERRHAHDGVRVIGRAAHHRVQILALKHPPKIRVALGLGKLLDRPRQPPRIHVAKRDNILALHPRQITRPAPRHADHTNV